jgi:hypothetical protein
MADDQERWQQRLAKRRAGTPWSVMAREEGIHPNTFRDQLKKARQTGWIPSEEELPPSIRSDGKRVGLPAKAVMGSVDTDAVQSPVHIPAHTINTDAVQSVDTGAVQALDTGAVQRLDRLEDDVQGLRQLVQAVIDRLNHTPVRTPVQITTLPPYPKGKSVRWNLWILEAIRDELASLAAERDISPSQLVQELLWKELRRE